ncbi:MAG: phosphoribosylformylglycinamidine synthase subunit PurQ [Planctomycetaceae bacterium]|nr:phosphoribosylformylglycinamidine synthase subunit PurQ [Planctomycetaceae bacterium]
MTNILLLRSPGTHGDLETAYAFEQAGGKAERLHLNRVLEKPELLREFQVLCFPGGFSFGDDVAAGKILACQLKSRLSETLQKFKDAGKLILGIGNGFQALVKSGLLLDENSVTLTWNPSGVYTDRWVKLRAVDSKCVFLRGVDSLYLPIAHAEGRFVARNGQIQAALKYAHGDNPNGSQDDVAGICDTTGRVFGLMPHPERFIDPLQHPHWTRIAPKDRPRFGDGFKLFQNAVEFFR